jgi:N-acetylglucosamine-6-phosphate deacetylase
LNLEGPFISSQRLGAQPAFARPATWEEVQALHALAPLRVITLAPEALGDATELQRWQAAGIVAQIGHSNATFEEGQAALQAGAKGFTHLFNAMSALHHRQPGLVGLALAQAEFAEVIPDLLHVHPGAIQAALRAIPKLYAVTDATAGTDMPDGNYLLGTQAVCKCAGGVRLADGTLAGSVLTMDQALRNLVTLGLPLADAVRRVATYPAQFLGEADIGHLSPGAHADVVQLSPALQVQRVWVGGQEVPLA